MNSQERAQAVLSKDSIKAMIKYGLISLFVLMIGCGSYFTIAGGVVGVTYNTITGKTTTAEEGLHFKLPFVTDVYKFDSKTQREDIKADSASKDLQKVHVQVVINYRLKKDKVNELFLRVGRDFSEKVVHPAVWECVKASTAQFPVEEIIVKRETVKEMIETTLKSRLEVYNIILESVNLVNISFDDEFNKVVEAKQIEEQKIKTAEYKKKQAEQNKMATILDAEAEARKQELLRATISKDTVMMKWIEKWDGKLPTYMMGDKTMMMVPSQNQ